MELDLIKSILKNDKDLLLRKLAQYGSSEKRRKQYSCIHCSSSDALGIKEGNDGYFYHCFSCGETGDIIKLVQEKEGLSFYKAIELLAGEQGIPMPVNKATGEKPVRTESINYSNYKADEVITVQKYINTYDLSLSLLKAKARQGEIVLAIAPTGCGKTYSIINMLKRDKETKSIFIVPNAANVEQIKVEYNIPGAWGDIPVAAELEKGNVVVMTWNKFESLNSEILKDYIVILDEVHQTYIEMFRRNTINKLYENLSACKGQIHITATPNKIDFNVYSYILEYVQEVQTKYNVKVYSNVDDNEINSIIRRSKKFGLFMNDINYLNFIKSSNLDKRIGVITSSTKELSSAYKEIMTKSTMKSVDGICNTSVLTAGVNIKEPDMTDIIIVGQKDIATIKQYVARFRELKEVNVHIFNKFENEESKVYNLEWLVSVVTSDVQDRVNIFNRHIVNRSFIEDTFDLSPIRLAKSQEFYWSDTKERYIIDPVGIRNLVYTNYYNKATAENFKVLLNEYFENIEVVNINENKEDRKHFIELIKEDKENALRILNGNKEILVGAVEILNHKVTKDTDRYLAKVGLSQEYVLEQIKSKDLDKYILTSNIAKTINLYSKYVVDNGYNYELAWNLANKGNRARGKFFSQLNNLVYREVEKEFPEYMRYELLDDKIYNQIVNTFEVGKSYTKEHLEYFCKGINMMYKTKLTVNKLGEQLANIFNIENKNLRELPSGTGIDFLYKENIVSIPVPGKRIRVYTIKNYLTLDDLQEQHSLDNKSMSILQLEINKQIDKYRKEVKEKENLF